MNALQDNATFVDWFKERLASPFLFTFSLSMIVWNWKFIGWVLYQPLNFEDKLRLINAGKSIVSIEWFVPLILTFIIIIISPFANILSEICAKIAKKKSSIYLSSKGHEEYVEASKHYNEIEKISALQRDKADLVSECETLRKSIHSLHNDLKVTNDSKDELMEKLGSDIEHWKVIAESESKRVENKIIDLNKAKNQLLAVEAENEKISQTLSTKDSERAAWVELAAFLAEGRHIIRDLPEGKERNMLSIFRANARPNEMDDNEDPTKKYRKEYIKLFDILVRNGFLRLTDYGEYKSLEIIDSTFREFILKLPSPGRYFLREAITLNTKKLKNSNSIDS